ncbi:MAG: DUF2442 domain-containing protein [Chloroflexi bacterium]|nr:MAG: DUF2442 domain-containing protein [Chloroflexota bacterium]MBL1196157.1 DUF2442 domain-containing protein [Chloroflexota bacterium]NOH13450.1 DUF2442 domain-containing protein [Chloroflexota bacterium]
MSETLLTTGTSFLARAQSLELKKDAFSVHLEDGRIISVPLVWYPKLASATKEQLENYRLIGDGEGIHWEDLDEDISVAGLMSPQLMNKGRVEQLIALTNAKGQTEYIVASELKAARERAGKGKYRIPANVSERIKGQAKNPEAGKPSE